VDCAVVADNRVNKEAVRTAFGDADWYLPLDLVTVKA
jgi:hypothetical protein